MNTKYARIATSVVILSLLFTAANKLVAQEEELTQEQVKFFETKIRPVLVKECYSCHSKTGNTKGSLLVDSKHSLMKGGDSGPAIVPGDLDKSLLWSAINYEEFSMPPRNPLSDEEIADFRKWILMGAPDPRVTKISNVNSTVSKEDIERGREFWSYKKPEAPKVPKAMNSQWPKTDVDQFVAVELEKSSLEPNEDAPSLSILRRLCFDLNGLPPTPEQVRWFEKEWAKNPDDAIVHVVDALLEKPQFGERWGRHWLDVARYGESSGKEFNATFPHAWRYRDYVIDSFNDDKPYDRFVQEQIAGDLLPAKTDEQWQENLIATGFLAIGSKTLAEQNRLKFRMDLIDEQIDATTRVVLGVSVACARCHDHKFDAIPQSDYYALAGIFQSTETFYGTVGVLQNRNPTGLIELPIEDTSDFDKPLTKDEIAKIKQDIADKQEEAAEARRERFQSTRGGDSKMTSADASRILRQTIVIGNQITTLQSQLEKVDENGKPLTFCMGVQPADRNRNARVLVGGEVDQPAQEVSRGFVQVLGAGTDKIASDSSGRLELARWMSSRDNPLAARVMVNRIWQHLIGEGIVRSPDDFGITGASPTHQELLDHLAVRFMDSGWSVKTIVREIATSRVYRISSDHNDAKLTTDPENKLLWRATKRRLEGESIRDAMLAVSGELDLERPRGSLVAQAGEMRYDGAGGSVAQAMMMADGQMNMNNLPPEVRERMNNGRMSDQNRRAMQEMIQKRIRERMKDSPYGGGLDSGRAVLNDFTVNAPHKHRSVYLPLVRDGLPRSLDLFDMPEPSMIVGKRETSDTATQALYMMNNDFVLKMSEALAAKVTKQHRDVQDQVKQAFLNAYGRDATEAELEIASEFLQSSVSGSGASGQRQAMTMLCQAIFASAEFRYLN